jgi:hypothetical protein
LFIANSSSGRVRVDQDAAITHQFSSDVMHRADKPAVCLAALDERELQVTVRATSDSGGS